MDKVVVIGCAVPGYAIVRALANKNIKIIALTYADRDIAHLSRYVSEVVQISRPEKDEKKFIEFLVSRAPQWGGALLLESSDNVATILSKNKDVLSKYYKLVTPDWEILSQFIEKGNTCKLAEKCGVPFPKTKWLSKMDDLDEVTDIMFPVILKPVNSFSFQYKFVVKNFIINDEHDLKNKYKICLDAGQSMILQEFIPGSDDNLYKLHGYINTGGNMVGKMFYRKMRQSPPQSGVMRVGISTERNPEVEELTEILLNHVFYRGYFNSEFKFDSRDGKFKLIEVNCRMPRGGMLPTAAGINYPWIVYLDLIKNQQVIVNDYKKGFYWIEIVADLFYSIYRRNKTEKISLINYIKPYLSSDKVFADLDFMDLRPIISLVRRRVGNAIKKTFRKKT